MAPVVMGINMHKRWVRISSINSIYKEKMNRNVYIHILLRKPVRKPYIYIFTIIF